LKKKKSGKAATSKGKAIKIPAAVKAQAQKRSAPGNAASPAKVYRSIRKVKCPEDRGIAQLLLEWKVDRGRKVLCSVTCDNFELADYSGSDCQWLCWAKIAGGKP
jgi:hypothetical protein